MEKNLQNQKPTTYSIYVWIKDISKATGLNYTTMAIDIGVSSNVITRYMTDFERGKRRLLAINTLKALFKKYKIEPPFCIEEEKKEEIEKIEELKTRKDFIKKFIRDCCDATSRTQKELEEILNLKSLATTRVLQGIAGTKTQKQVLNSLSRFSGVSVPEELEDLKMIDKKVRVEGLIDFSRGDSISLHEENINHLVSCPSEELLDIARMKAVRIKGAPLCLCVSNNSFLYYKQPTSVKVPYDVLGKDCVVKKADGMLSIKNVVAGNKKGEYFLYSTYDKNRPLETITEDDIQWIAKIKYIKQSD